VVEALRHAGVHHGCSVEVDWVDSESVGEAGIRAALTQADGILIPGGFGGRGFEGKIRAAQIAREHKIPYLGICLGMQVAVIELSRDAHPFFVASQYHPEFKSRPERPAPLFREFVGSALAHAQASTGAPATTPADAKPSAGADAAAAETARAESTAAR